LGSPGFFLVFEGFELQNDKKRAFSLGFEIGTFRWEVRAFLNIPSSNFTDQSIILQTISPF
jgi:hypothetical protein